MRRVVIYIPSVNFGKKELEDALGKSYLDKFETLPGEAKKLLLAGGLYDLMNLKKSQEKTTGQAASGPQVPDAGGSTQAHPVWAAHSFTGGYTVYSKD